MALIPKPKFPNVPQLPGVPQVLRSPTFPPAPPPIVGTALALGHLWQAIFSKPQWGIYKTQKPAEPTIVDGEVIEGTTTVAERKPVVVPDSFLEFGNENEWDLPNYPVEDGSFTTYNKVEIPYEIVLRMAKGGSTSVRREFLDSLRAIAGTTDLYDILTPEKTYIAVNVLRFTDARRGRKNAHYFDAVDVYFRQIRQTASTYTNTSALTMNAKNPSAAPVSNLGSIQPQVTDYTPDLLGIDPPTSID